MLGRISNPLLQKAEQGIESKVPPNRQADLQKVVNAGMTIFYSPQLKDARNQMIQRSTDPAKEAGLGAAKLISELYQQSNKTMPTDIAVPAAMIFGLQYLDLLANVGKTQITPDLVANATSAIADNVLPLFGVTPDKMQQLITLGKQKQAAGQPGQQPGQPAPQGAMPPPMQATAPQQAAPAGIMQQARGQ